MKKVILVKLKEAMFSVLPIALIVLFLFFTPLLSLSVRELAVFGVATLLLILGIGLFNIGADHAMTPMGEHIGSGLTKSRNLWFLMVVCFGMGVLITVAEPDLSVLAAQVADVISGTLLIVFVGVGVGLFLLIAVLKVVFRKSLSSLLLFFYMTLFALTSLVIASGNGSFVPLAFDSGGVTTGPITVPFIMALGVGIAATLGGTDTGENSFGFVALCSIGPILAVSVLSISVTGDIAYELPDYSMEAHLGEHFLPTVLNTVKEVGLALGLIVLFFTVLQVTFLHLPKRKLRQIAVGVLCTFAGLVIFLSAVTIGFMPVGYRLGESLAKADAPYLVGFAFLLGLVVVLAEPAVHVLNKQVEEITDGAVKKSSMMIALSVGVGISIVLSVLRILFQFSILYYVIPGYFLSLGLSFFVPPLYTAIAFDSGGVASGPLTSGFILPFAIGACYALHGTGGIMEYAFGVVAMVAMTPLITIQLLGFRAVVSRRVRETIAMRKMLGADDEQIIRFM